MRAKLCFHHPTYLPQTTNAQWCLPNFVAAIFLFVISFFHSFLSLASQNFSKTMRKTPPIRKNTDCVLKGQGHTHTHTHSGAFIYHYFFPPPPHPTKPVFLADFNRWLWESAKARTLVPFLLYNHVAHMFTCISQAYSWVSPSFSVSF